MPIGPEIIIGAIACVLCSISGVACLFTNKQDFANFCGCGQRHSAYLGEQVLDLEGIAMMQAARIEQLEAYIHRQSGAAAGRIFIGDVLQGTAMGAPHAPPQSPAAAAQNGPQAGTGRTNILMPQICGLGGYGRQTATVTMPYLPRHQRSHYPYAGARVL